MPASVPPLLIIPNGDGASGGGGGEVKPEKHATAQSSSKLGQGQASQVMRQGYQGAQEAARQYAGVFTEVTRRSPFELWPREAMIDLLVMQNIELRHEDELEHFQLVNICNQIFAGKPLPAMPIPNSAEQQRKAEIAAARIQHLWIYKNKARKAMQVQKSANSDRVLTGGVILPPSAAALNEQGSSRCPTPNSAWKELELEWLRPDVNIAKEYAEYNHPRMGGPGGDLFPVNKTTAGRYCILGGCGEQLDLWDEGAVSELALFGSGITNYFKFLKWCAWTSLMLFVIYIPQLIVNTFGAGGVSFSSYTDIAKTTLGNLVTSSNGVIDTVSIPYCQSFSDYFHVLNCDLNKTSLALLYTYVDVSGCVFLFLAWLWLRRFQRVEASHLDRHTVTASDYTVKVKGIPHNVTEMDIRKHFASTLNLSVAGVALGYNNAEELGQYQQRGDLMRERHHVVNRYRYINTLKLKFKAGQVWYLIRELPYLKARNDRLLKRIQQLDRKIGLKQAERHPLCAFVTFNSQNEVVQALAAYRWTLLRYLFMPKALRLKGNRIRLERAPEPSLILWENLQYSTSDRLRRKLTTTFLAASLISISIILAFVARYYQEQNLTTDSSCPDNWASMTSAAQQNLAKGDSRYLGCFCRDKDFITQVNHDVCKVYLQKTSLAVFWTLFASFSVVVVNYLLQMGLEAMTKYEKHHSLDRQELEISLRVFLLKFINTGCVCLLLNSRDVQKVLGIHVSSYGNFTAQWYMTTGLSLIVVMVMNVFGPVAPSLYYYYLTRKHQRHAEAGETSEFMTQEAMNNVFMGPEFKVSDRYAMNLVILFVCFIYASGMPILLLLAALSFIAGYWADKFLFLRYYRIPPQYGQELSKGVTDVVGYAVFLHLLVSIWAYSQQDIFTLAYENSSLARFVAVYSTWTDSVSERLPRKNILPLLMLLLCLVGFTVLRYLSKWTTKCSRALWACMTCGSGMSKHDNGLGDLNSIDVTYQRAVERGLIKGLATYNILQNPKYKKAFAISDAFAAKHTHVESIRQTLSGGFEDEEGEGGSEHDVDESRASGAHAYLNGPPVSPTTQVLMGQTTPMRLQDVAMSLTSPRAASRPTSVTRSPVPVTTSPQAHHSPPPAHSPQALSPSPPPARSPVASPRGSLSSPPAAALLSIHSPPSPVPLSSFPSPAPDTLLPPVTVLPLITIQDPAADDDKHAPVAPPSPRADAGGVTAEDTDLV